MGDSLYRLASYVTVTEHREMRPRDARFGALKLKTIFDSGNHACIGQGTGGTGSIDRSWRTRSGLGKKGDNPRSVAGLELCHPPPASSHLSISLLCNCLCNLKKCGQQSAP